MNPALFGALTALGWGSADFIARFTGRAVGQEMALAGMLAVSAVALSLLLWLAGYPLEWSLAGWWQLLLTGLGVMGATLLLYWGLVRGPVSVVAPIVGSYPVFNIVFALALGVRPSAVQWVAIFAVLLGVVVVARATKHFEIVQHYGHAFMRRTLGIALAASLGFAGTAAAGQAAAGVYGEVQTIALARWISLVGLALLMLALRRPARAIPYRWWPILALQGLLDAGAYVALFAGGRTAHPEVTVVVAAGFSAVTVVLARLVLREPMTGKQWGGIGLIVGGAAALSV